MIPLADDVVLMLTPAGTRGTDCTHCCDSLCVLVKVFLFVGAGKLQMDAITYNGLIVKKQQ